MSTFLELQIEKFNDLLLSKSCYLIFSRFGRWIHYNVQWHSMNILM